MLGTLSQGPEFLCRHLGVRGSPSQAGLPEKGEPQTTVDLHRAMLKKPRPGLSAGHGWESLENKPANSLLGEKDSKEPSFRFKGLWGWGWGKPPQ